jgi:hypothetical protein
MPLAEITLSSGQKNLLKSWYFGYNKGMKWVRRILVYLLSIVLLVSLFGIALSTSARISLSHPSKIESWLDQSNLYTNLITSITDQAQTAIENNVSGGTSISKTVVQEAAQSAFPQSLLKQDTQTFLNSNYAWLEGKTATPSFNIDLSGAKQEFATKVAQSSVATHLTNLPACTVSQTLQLQSANPLLLSCRPVGVSTQVEVAQISQQVANNGSFLGNPVITASTFSNKGAGGNRPYYARFSKLPKAYQITQQLPWILGIVAIVSMIGITFWSRSKRAGLRRIGITLLTAGVLLVIDKVATDAGFNKLKDKAFNSLNNHQIQQSLTSFAHYVEAELVKIDLWFGIVYIAIAVILLGILLFTRNRRPKSAKSAKPDAPTNNRYESGPSPRQSDFNTTNSNAGTVNPAQAQTVHQNLKKRTRRRPPRLVQ